MHEISSDEVKRLAYETLSYFADFCDAHGLRYFLAYGTLLGAVRHGGFIPWDDDIDVWMPREDYDKLLLTYKDEIVSDLYELYAIEINPACWLPFGKLSRKDTVVLPPAPYPSGYVRRIALDIFPLDVFAASDDEAEACAEYANFYARKTRIARRYHLPSGVGWKKIVKSILYKAACLRYGDYTPRIRAWAHMLADCPPQNWEKARYLISPEELFLYRKEWFQESVKLKFESGQFNAPADYDSVLRRAYGDYMTPPPPEKRHAPHIGKAYYIDR